MPNLIAVMGPTASGKTDLAESIANQIDAQLINADAFQIYRGMDIGTAKPSNTTAYRMIDIRNPSEGFGVGEFVAKALEILSDCWEKNRSAVVVGGTGLYIRALFEEYTDMGSEPDPEVRGRLDKLTLDELVSDLKEMDPESAMRVDLRNRVRVQRRLERMLTPKPSVPVRLPPFERLKLAVVRDPIETSERIRLRVESMFGAGWVEEVRRLESEGYVPADPGMRALGYRSIWKYIAKEITLDEVKATTITETIQYAKRQRTWLRSEPNLTAFYGDNAQEEALQFIL